MLTAHADELLWVLGLLAAGIIQIREAEAERQKALAAALELSRQEDQRRLEKTRW